MTDDKARTPAGAIPRFGLPDRIRKARETAGLDRSQAADALELARRTLYRYESAAAVPPRRNLVALAALTGVSDHWLITGDDGPCPNALAAGACGCRIDSLEPRA
ncbi:helix-turn-helix transcriptional regulator [Actinomyces radicidentis]|uniref:helix-turn-helix domain-containing protein n=1 Tax=Actinomyces radicidentis TaxID=111015 RepID=UPI0028EFA9FE|nr:helix-turn-helix transcriptional regulator [Actinomyces radicidentis]